MGKRSPRYPRHSLIKAIDMTRKMFAGAHQSKIDVDSAAKVIGYSGSGGGAASSAIGALRQYGLVDGLRGDVAVSDLAMRILQPMDAREQAEAVREAAMKPEMFDRIVNQFGGKLPGSDEPIKAFLIRQEGFSTAGADELIETLRETLSSLPELPASDQLSINEAVMEVAVPVADERGGVDPLASTLHSAPKVGELITLPLGQNCKAELRLIGDVTAASYARLIKHLELLREIEEEEG